MNIGIERLGLKRKDEKPLTLSDCIANEIGYRTSCESLMISIKEMDSYFDFMNNICDLERVARKYNSTECMKVIDAIVDGRRVRISVENFITEFFKKAKDFFVMIFNKIKDFFVMLTRKFKEFLIRKKSLKDLAAKDDRTINATVQLINTSADNSIMGYISDSIDKIKQLSDLYVEKSAQGDDIGARLDQVTAGANADKVSKGVEANKANIDRYLHKEDVNIAKMSDASNEYDKLCDKIKEILQIQNRVEDCKDYVDKVFSKLNTKRPEVLKESKYVVNSMKTACTGMISILTKWTSLVMTCQNDLVKVAKEAYVKSPSVKKGEADSQKKEMNEPSDQAAQWFNSIVAQQQKDMLAHYVFRTAWNANLKVEVIEDLQKKYGKCSLPPSIREYEEDFNKYFNVDELNKFAVAWLSKHGVQATESNWEKVMDKWCQSEQQKKAEKIVASVK